MRVWKAQNGQIEFLGHIHQAHRLAVAFRVGHAEIVLQAFLDCAALLMAHDHDRASLEARQSANNGFVIAEDAIASEFLEIVKDVFDEIGQVRPVRMARHEGLPPCAEIRVHLLQLLARLGLQLLQLVGDRWPFLAGSKRFQFGDLRVQLRNGLFEIKIGRCHGGKLAMTG